MAPDKAINERDKLQSQVRFHRAMNAGLLGTLFFGVLLLGFVVVRDTTKIVPPEVKRPYEIGSNYANKDYLLDMAGYVLGTVLTVTPETVDYNNKVILKMADPDGYAGLKTALDAAAMRLKQERVSQFRMLAKSRHHRSRALQTGQFQELIRSLPQSDRPASEPSAAVPIAHRPDAQLLDVIRQVVIQGVRLA